MITSHHISWCIYRLIRVISGYWLKYLEQCEVRCLFQAMNEWVGTHMLPIGKGFETATFRSKDQPPQTIGPWLPDYRFGPDFQQWWWSCLLPFVVDLVWLLLTKRGNTWRVWNKMINAWWVRELYLTLPDVCPQNRKRLECLMMATPGTSMSNYARRDEASLEVNKSYCAVFRSKYQWPFSCTSTVRFPFLLISL